MLGLSSKEEPDMTHNQKVKYFLTAHWRGTLVFFAPLILLPVVAPFPGEKYQWCGYTLLLMAIFWVTECIPLAVTGFLPMVIFPFTGVLSSSETCNCYMNDSIMMFLGSLMLAAAVEQSGLHERLAYCAIRIIGYSHYKLLLAMCVVTTFVSMWITNTAATTMMVPIIFALLKVFESEKILKMYDTNSSGDKVASDITTCYFCAATYSATIGGIGTLVGTATNLVFKGLFQTEYPDAPDYLSFPLFSAFAVPYMIIMEALLYLCLIYTYFGFLRPKSPEYKASRIAPKVQEAAKKTIEVNMKKLGKITYWEVMVLILFGGAMIGFFCRSPQIFSGWGDVLIQFFGLTDNKFIRDSALAIFISFWMYTLPAMFVFVKYCKAKFHEDLPKSPAKPVLDWTIVNVTLPFSFMFLLGGGFALSTAAKSSGLNDKLGETLQKLNSLPNYVILFLIILIVIFITNFASNVAVCNVLAPIAMQLATKCNVNPLWYNIAAGYSASYCFMLPVGTPGNLVVQCAAKIPTKKMIRAGFLPTITTLIVTWIALCFWAPVIWPDLNVMPDWAGGGGGGAEPAPPAPGP